MYEKSGGKTPGELLAESLWFFTHLLFALGVYIAMVAVVYLLQPQPSYTLILIGTGLAFLLPAIAGFIIQRFRPDRIARHVWVFGLVYFCAICVYVLDLPTGPGLCDHCGAWEKVIRTVITFDSGLMESNGDLVGSWPALAWIGYAIGARRSNKMN
jgi:hypothetical protein